MTGLSFNDPFGSLGVLIRNLLLGLGLPDPWVTFIQFLVGAIVLIGVTLGAGAIVLIWIERKVEPGRALRNLPELCRRCEADHQRRHHPFRR